MCSSKHFSHRSSHKHSISFHWIQLMSYCHLVRMSSKITGNNSLERSFTNTCSIPSATHPSWISFQNFTNCFDISNRSSSFMSPRYPFVSVMTWPCIFYVPPHCRFSWRPRSANRSLNALRATSRLPVLKIRCHQQNTLLHNHVHFFLMIACFFQFSCTFNSTSNYSIGN